MEKELEKLIQKRKNLVNALKENEAEGIHALLSDLYPDTAHFIFELLQNAEDMNATTVRFILDHNGIDFEHNGTKRDFNISDIDAITNIGHNKQKKDDPTSIGKFGVGFKAVFGYTSTPIIHSGNYHFKIEDYFVPEFNGINAISTIDNSGVSWTKFSFPFNNPDKPADKAFEECLHGLEALDSTSILFLQNIQKIEYMLPSGDLGYVECTEGRAHHITITYKKPDNNVETKSTWLRFNRVVDMIDDQGNNKTLPIAVAFSIASKNHKEKIIPVNGMGKTFIYFPAEKEHSGLRFHINAPFASTVARDSVRNCTDNTKLIKEISKLIVDSLPKIKAQGLMNSSFFEVLPNGKEDIPFFYSHIYDYIDVAFRNNEYLPTQNGGYVTSKAAITGPAEISNLLDDEDIKMLTGMDKHWILKAPQKNSNADNFINSLNIEIFSYNEFTEIFDITNRKQTEDLICEKNKSIGNKWLEKLYTLCINTYNTYNNIMEAKRRSTFIDNLKRSTIIKGVDGQLYKPKDILILPINVSLVTKTTPIVEQEFVLGEAKNRIREFFKNQLNIREYGPKVEIESRLQKYADEAYYGTYDNIYSSMIYGVEFNKNEEYFNDILSFAKYKVQYNDIHFEYEKLFVYRNESDNKLYRTSAAHLYLGKKYNNTNGELLAEICGKKCLWDGYAEHYKDDELKLFLEFATSCGASKELKIEQQSAAEHPLYRSELWSDGKSGSLGEDSDYTIPYLEKLLKANSYKVNRLIWKTLVRYGKKEGYKYIEARYAQSGRVKVKTCDSSLIYYLKQYAWIPDKQDVFYKPADIEIDNLGKDFVYSQSNKILEALQIGSAFDEKKKKLAMLEQDAKELGKHIISDEDYKYLQDCKEKQRSRNNNAISLNSQELLEKQNKQIDIKLNSRDAVFNRSSLKEEDIVKTFRDAKNMNQTEKKLFAKSCESTKEERAILKKWYNGRCQMCKTRIVGYNGNPYFVAKNIIKTQDLTIKNRHTMDIGWNSMCLCPNCAAKYDVCNKDLGGLYDQIMQQEASDSVDGYIVLTIELDGKIQEIHYTSEHFLALKKSLQLIDIEIKN